MDRIHKPVIPYLEAEVEKLRKENAQLRSELETTQRSIGKIYRSMFVSEVQGETEWKRRLRPVILEAMRCLPSKVRVSFMLEVMQGRTSVPVYVASHIADATET